MARWFTRLAGSTDRFAVEITFADDPHDGRSATPAESVSWGSLRLFVHGREPTATVGVAREAQDGLRWYLLPVLAWVANGWDALLHETRFPIPVPGASAADRLARAFVPYGAARRHEQQLWEYFQRHALISARQGGIFPNIVFQRSGDSMEVSWDDTTRPGTDRWIRFAEPSGSELVPIADFASVWHEVLREAAAALLSRRQDPDLRAFDEAVRSIDRPGEDRNRKRRALLLGLRPTAEETIAVWQDLASRGIVIPAAPSHDLYEESSLPAVLFASFSPTIEPRDVSATLALLPDLRPMSDSLRALARNEPCPTHHAWESGYSLALEAREALGLGYGPIQIERELGRLGVGIRDIALSQRDIRGLALLHGEASLIALNTASGFWRESWSRAATLAHELAHILFDRNLGADLAVASGPWAPSHVEQRANAFAAMFLMPEPALVDEASRQTSPADLVRAVAHGFGTSFESTIQHLYSLGLLDEEARALLLEDITFLKKPTALGDSGPPSGGGSPGMEPA